MSSELIKPLPGESAQLKMAPRGIHNFPNAIKNPSPAAVLLLLFPDKDIPYTVFIKRSEYQGAHSGQISLPGGKIEKSDATLEETALRETSEELGFFTKDIKILGKLSPLFIPVSGFNVHPFLGVIQNKPRWNPDKTEVTYIIETSVQELSSPKIIKSEQWQLHGTLREVPFYLIQNEKLWGATAMIVSEFLEIIQHF